jgi:recombination protein RecA
MAPKKKEKDKEKPEAISADDLKTKSPQELLMATFKTAYGENSLVPLSEDLVSSVKEFVDTGSYLVNDAISNGRGWPVGKIVTIVGLKSSGKSTLAAHLLAGAQKLGAITVLLDTEYAFDSERAKVIGVDTDNLLIAQPDHMEMALEQIEKVVAIAKATDRLVVIVWDSIAATPTKKEIEGEIGDGGHYGEHSKILSGGFRRLMRMVAETRCILYVVNQIKTKINAKPWENPETIIGQNPLDYHSHVMIRIAQCGKISDSDGNEIGIMSRIKVLKNRVAPPFREAEIPIMFDIGIDRAREALEIGKKYRRARQKGAWQQICIECPNCYGTAKLAKGECQECEKTGLLPHPTIKQFYEKDVREMMRTFKGLEAYLVYGTPIPQQVAEAS